MAFLKSFKNCKVSIRNSETGRKICDAIVQDYDQEMATISVDSECFELHSYSKVLLLILHQGTPYEFSGNVRHNSAGGYTAITLFKGKVKESRAVDRHLLEAPAVIESRIVNGVIQQLISPICVTVTNISTEGILIYCKESVLELSSFFQLKLMIGGRETVINNCVIRVDASNPNRIEYGCKFISLPG